MNNAKITFALFAMLGGLVSATQAQAAAGTVMLGPTNFANRCLDQGGAFFPLGDGYSCELATTQIDCLFEGANAYCEWEGGPNKREVIRVIGMLDAESLAGQSFGGAKKKGGGINIPDLPIQNK
jgi:hypothetical protein